ncbi:MAG: flippase-like domain-containing protein [Burkholderiales bacterium]|nr:MAG: flippase-like domain-containing protein [Burkholderiales bacterium]
MNGYRIAATIMLALALAVALAWWPGLGELWERSADLGWGGWALGTSGLLLSYALRAGRVHAEWSPRCGASALDCLQITLTHNAAINLMPMRAGELSFPYQLWRRFEVPVADSASSLVWMRVQDMVVLAWLAVLSLAGLMWVRGGTAQWLAMPMAAVTSVVFGAVALQGARWSETLHRRWLARGAAARAGWRGLVTTFLAALARVRPSTWWWCIANWVAKLATLGGLIAMLAGLPWLAGVCGAIAGEAAAALPVQAPAGFGTYEAAVALGAAAVATPALPQVLPAALVSHLFVLAVSVLAAALAWGLRGGPLVAENKSLEGR